MAKFATLRPEYQRLLDDVQLTRASGAHSAAVKVINNSARYKLASQTTGVPWPLIGALDYRESDCDPRAALGQGDPWNRVSTHIPRGKGPFESWAEAAVFYLRLDGVDTPPADWDMAVACWEAEKYNGFGPRNHGATSGYVWSGTNHYNHGKYVADGVWNPDAVDQQLGVVAILYEIARLAPGDMAWSDGSGEPVPTPAEPFEFPDFKGTRWIQSRLNVIAVANSDTPEQIDLLVVDGNYGRKTRAMVMAFQEWQRLAVDGQAGDLTTAAMDKELAKIK